MSAFPDVSAIPFEGPASKNPLAFRHYDADELVEGKTMREHLRFLSHVLAHLSRHRRRPLRPRYGMLRPWDDGSSSVENAQNRAHVAFEFIEKARRALLRFPRPRRGPRGQIPGRGPIATWMPWWGCSRRNRQRTGIKLLWGTASLFTNPRFVHGAATSPNAEVLCLRRRAGEERPSRLHTNSAARATRSGAGARDTRRSGTPT